MHFCAIVQELPNRWQKSTLFFSISLSKNDDMLNKKKTNRIEYDTTVGVIRDVTDDDEEIKLSPFVKKLLWLVRNIPN